MNIFKQFFSNFFPVTIEKRIGKYLPHLEVNFFKGKYMLDGENLNYSFGSLSKIFQECFKHYKIQQKPIKEVLILGFGGGSVAHILQKEYKLDCNITGVELDPIVLELADKYFDLKSYKDTVIHCEDAFDFIQRDDKMYDLIVIDLFIGSRVPIQFLKPEFLFLIKNRLNSGAFVFYNKLSENQLQKNETLHLHDNMKKVFKFEIDILNVKYNLGKNTILVYHNEKVNNPSFVVKNTEMTLTF